MRPLVLPVLSVLSALALSGCQREYATPRHPFPAYAPALPPEVPSLYSVAAPPPPPLAAAVAPAPPSPPPSIAAESTAPPVNSAAPATSAPASGGATARPAAARLLQLKELLDRKLITPEEYEEHRRLIIDAL
jgi:hypothetical protein